MSGGSKESLLPWTWPSADDLVWIPKATDDSNIEIQKLDLAPAENHQFRRGTYGYASNQPPAPLALGEDTDRLQMADGEGDGYR